jgi:hypothetical protein
LFIRLGTAAPSTLFNCRRTAADEWYRESIASPYAAEKSVSFGLISAVAQIA